MHARTLSALAVAALSTALIAGPASAATDNFDGYTGTLNGQTGGAPSGGIAFTGPWTAPTGTFNVIQSTLGSASGQTSATPYVESIGFNEAYRGVTQQTNGVSYVYSLATINRGADGTFNNSFGGLGLFQNDTEKFLIGQRFQDGNFGLAESVGGGSGGSGTRAIPTDFTTVLLLGKLDQVNNSLTLFVNPDFGQTEANNTPDAFLTFGAGSDDSYNRIYLRGGGTGSDNVFQYDNLNVTNTSPFAAVPEPTSFAAIVAGAALTTLRRRPRA